MCPLHRTRVEDILQLLGVNCRGPNSALPVFTLLVLQVHCTRTLACFLLFSSEATDFTFSSLLLLSVCIYTANIRDRSVDFVFQAWKSCIIHEVHSVYTERWEIKRECHSLVLIRQFQEERGIQTKPQALVQLPIHLLVSLNITGQGTKTMMRK